MLSFRNKCLFASIHTSHISSSCLLFIVAVVLQGPSGPFLSVFLKEWERL